MASLGAIRAGRAFVELFADNSKLVRGLRAAESQLKAFGKKVRTFGLKVVGAVSAIFLPIGMYAVKAAADANESASRFQQVFKDQAKAAGEFADALAKAVGRSRYEIRDAMGTFQSFFVGMGFDAGISRELSQQLESLALDFASFNNISDDEAMQRFISALSGSSEVLDRFGINIKQAALEQELLRMGIKKSWQEVTEQEKALARLSVITRAMGDQGAVGDAIRTADSFANQMKRLKGQLRDTAVEIGQALLPVLAPVVAWVARAARNFGQWVQQNRQTVATIFQIAAAVAAAGIALVVLGTIMTNLAAIIGVITAVASAAGTVFSILGSIIGFLISPIGLVIAAVAALGGYILYATGAAGKALAWLGDRFGTLADDAKGAWQGIGDALAAGDIALAAKILWLTLKMEWIRGVGFLKEIWANLKYYSLTLVNGTISGILAAWEIGTHAIADTWNWLVGLLRRVWTGFADWFRTTWDGITNWLAKRMIDAYSIVGGLSDEEAAEAKKGLDEKHAAYVKQVEAERTADDKAWADRQKKREEEHSRRLAEIGEEFEATQGVLKSNRDAAVDAAKAELDAARKEWQAAIATAKEKRKTREAAGPGKMEGPDDLLDRARQSISGAPDALADQAARIGAQGTFNAASILGLQAGGVADRMANGIEKIEKNTRPLRDIDGLAFT